MEHITNAVVKFLTASLFLAIVPANAAAFSFDGGTSSSFTDSVSALKEDSKGPAGPQVSAAAPASNEFNQFLEGVYAASDDICKSAEIKLNAGGSLPGAAGLSGEFHRYLRRFPDSKLALVDEVKVRLSAGIGSDSLQLPGQGGLAVSITGVMEGMSQVVRPLESDRYCKELGALASLFQVKTVLPLGAGRIAEMKNGEIWKLPLVLRLGFGVNTGGATQKESLVVSFSAGKTSESKPSVTLYRMDDNRLRLRLRLDRVEARSSGASASGMVIPMSNVGLLSSENMLSGLVNQAWASEINKYLALQLSYGRSVFSGKKLLLEFILDPRDPAQMARLEKFLGGDFGILKRFIEMGVSFNNFSEAAGGAGNLGVLEDMSGLAGQSVAAEPGYAGSDLYNGQAVNLHVQVPVLHTQDNSWSSAYHGYQSLDKEGETLHVHQESAGAVGNIMNLPFIGALSKFNSQKSVYVVNKETADGRVTGPVMMFQQYEGLTQQSDGSARKMIDRVNGILAYSGLNGGGLLPASVLFPALPGDPDYDGSYPGQSAPYKTYKTVVMSFRLMISERGVQSIIFAPAQAIMKAYMNVMRETESYIIDKVMDLFTINKAGEVAYDRDAVRRRLGNPNPYEDGVTNPLDIVSTLARAATQVIRDIASVKEAGNFKEQSEKLAKITAGDSGSGLKYEDFLKVALQLAAPGDISAEVYLSTDKNVNGDADVNQTYQYNNSNSGLNNAITEVDQMRDRFAEPTLLTD